MGIIDDVVINAKNAADTAYKKAGEAVDIARLKINLAELNSRLSKKYELLGRMMYTEMKDTNTDVNSESVNALINEISSLLEQFKATEEYINSTKKQYICSKCGHENSKDAIYCNKCGNKLDI